MRRIAGLSNCKCQVPRMYVALIWLLILSLDFFFCSTFIASIVGRHRKVVCKLNLVRRCVLISGNTSHIRYTDKRRKIVRFHPPILRTNHTHKPRLILSNRNSFWTVVNATMLIRRAAITQSIIPCAIESSNALFRLLCCCCWYFWFIR